jgi:hypothetical protein
MESITGQLLFFFFFFLPGCEIIRPAKFLDGGLDSTQPSQDRWPKEDRTANTQNPSFSLRFRYGEHTFMNHDVAYMNLDTTDGCD